MAFLNLQAAVVAYLNLRAVVTFQIPRVAGVPFQDHQEVVEEQFLRAGASYVKEACLLVAFLQMAYLQVPCLPVAYLGEHLLAG